MNDSSHIITDSEIHELFKRRLLEQDVDDILNQKLIEMEAQLAFSNDLLLMPDLQKEQEMLKKLNAKTAFSALGKWWYTGLSCLLVVVSVILFNAAKAPSDKDAFAGAETSGTTVMSHQPATKQQNLAQDTKALYETLARTFPPAPPQQAATSAIDTLHAKEKTETIERQNNEEEKKSQHYFTGANGYTQSVTKSVNDSNKISVDTVFKGVKRVEIDGSFCDISVSTNAEDAVSLKGAMKLEFKGLVIRRPDYKLHCNQKDSVLTVSVENNRKSAILMAGSSNYEGHLDFVVPKKTSLVIKNASGNVSVTGLEGEVCHLGSDYGNISADHIKSQITINSSSGDILLNVITGEISCKAAYGNIDFKELTGDLKIASSSGNIKVSTLTGNAGITCGYGNVALSKINGNIQMNSASGNVTLEDLKAGNVHLNCNYGDIRISNATASISIKSSSGKINLKHVTGNIFARAAYGDMELNDITGNLDLGTSSGGIDISNLIGSMVIASGYGDINIVDCITQVSIKSVSGNVKGKNIRLVKDFVVFAGYGNVQMNFKNDISELSFDLTASSGNLRLDKNGIKLKGNNGKLFMQNGDILVKTVTSSGDQIFE